MIFGRVVALTLEVIPRQHLLVTAPHRLTHALYSNFGCQASDSQWSRCGVHLE